MARDDERPGRDTAARAVDDKAAEAKERMARIAEAAEVEDLKEASRDLKRRIEEKRAATSDGADKTAPDD